MDCIECTGWLTIRCTLCRKPHNWVKLNNSAVSENSEARQNLKTLTDKFNELLLEINFTIIFLHSWLCKIDPQQLNGTILILIDLLKSIISSCLC